MDKKTTKKEIKQINRNWHLIDAEGKVLGRLAAEAAVLLNGKHKPTFESHIDHGDFVVVINAEKITVTGAKYEDKKYYHYSGYPGGLDEKSYRQKFEKDPVWIIEKAVYGMIPSNRMRKERRKRLKVYVGSTHPHEAQLGTDKK